MKVEFGSLDDSKQKYLTDYNMLNDKKKRLTFSSRIVSIIKISCILLLSTLFISIPNAANTLPSLDFSNVLMKQHTFAVENGIGCVATQCLKELSKCLSNAQSAHGLGCFIICSTNDIIQTSRDASKQRNNERSGKLEGSCEVQSIVLYQNKLLDDFTECSLMKFIF